ncbi:HlyD family type I secretion periplasmic adaptor subunit [Pseudomonas sp. GD03858]|uniref:HlyD family type I secretion periplasmic adaptor subunit n=1 Tax=unclassified Pseudomonas TaxID=196821 RepID=UPI00244D2F4A|nr:MULTISPECIES: HlyD family type I secretion periplasmic adaptor subunit [unclassified Pseudomonas]MDH0647029.1 HlyD family type I secretion periplasmic adaptor subunit [Pseudomonas sp. GD03867]MDH0664638.1 HlyD family type I secretion periplasmic adaptor subunit [Pseudomonas sp. GD03858]
MSVHPLFSSGAASQAQNVQPLRDDARGPARAGRWLVLVGLGGFLLWGALAPLDKGVPVSGNVVVAGSRQAVQHPTGGVIEQLLVRDGDQVHAGQVLLRMDATQAEAQQGSLRVQYVNARAGEARLLAERDGRSVIDFPAILREQAATPWVATALEAQRQLLASRGQALRLELDGLGESIAGAEASLLGLQGSLASKQVQRDALDEQLGGLRELARDGYIPRNRLLDSERLLAQVNGSIAEDMGSIGRTRRQVQELKLRIGQRHQEFQNDVRQQLSELQASAEDLDNRLRSAGFELAHTQVRAPVSGTVVGLSVFTNGGVIARGQQLMEIVPSDAPLLVDARASVELVDRLRPGLPVELLFAAFNQSTTPRVPGEVTLVSADRLLDDKTQQPYYQVRIKVSEQGLRQLAGLDIRPGMPVEAFVRTGERSLLNYLFKPLLDRVHVALAEE